MAQHPMLMYTLALAVADVEDNNEDAKTFSALCLEWMATDIHHDKMVACHDELLRSLVKASEYTGSTSIAEAFKTQSTQLENRMPMVNCSGLLTALSRMALLFSDEAVDTNDNIRACAVLAIERLSTVEEARPIMSHHEGIMTALTRANFKKFSTSHISPKDLGEDGQYIDNINEGDSELEEQVHLLTKVALKNLADIL
mmetsp:Transcript_9962/g.10103  ORF Transcript_9962/g.10103 Transcript_9962/m.10103 type:complete len:199 (+) Transcript_9962:1147-1743(+)